MWYARSDSNVCMLLIRCKESLSREYCALCTSSYNYYCLLNFISIKYVDTYVKMAASNKDSSTRISVTGSASSNRSYGSFQRSAETKGYKEYNLEPTDTLVGLSIKHNVSVSMTLVYQRRSSSM